MKSIISNLVLFACGFLLWPLSSQAQLITTGMETQANTTTANSQQWPAAAMDANGNFVVAWESYGQEGTTYGIYCQRFDNTGTPLGAEFRANTTTNNDQRFP
ncbi:MAG: hypothetical protein KDC43_28205, partial [Saprospiraceae bacterium]|nr:hypothetical protein [Saprospiraceae bacterium]